MKLCNPKIIHFNTYISDLKTLYRYKIKFVCSTLILDMLTKSAAKYLSIKKNNKKFNFIASRLKKIDGIKKRNIQN